MVRPCPRRPPAGPCGNYAIAGRAAPNAGPRFAPPRRAARRRPRAAGGFTVAELTIGLLVTSLVAAAAAALGFAVARQWDDADQSQSLQLLALQGARRLEACLRPARYVALVRAGSAAGTAKPAAAVVYWKNDDALPAGQVQLSEIALIQHDPAVQALYCYEAVFPANWTAAQVAAANRTYAYSALAVATAPEDFKAMPYVTGRPILKNVGGARFVLTNAAGPARRPAVEYTLTLTRPAGRPGQTATPARVQYGSVTLRGPLPQPN